MMNDEPVRVVFRLEGRPSLAEIVGGAVHFQALQAGVDTGLCGQLAQACEDVCRESLAQFGGADGGIEITIETFGDRMEFSVAHRGRSAPVVGLESFARSETCGGAEGGINGLDLLTCVERIRYSVDDGVARTTLVKFLPPKG